MHDTPSGPFYSRQPFAKCLTKFILKISISTILIIMSIRTTFYNECKNIDLTLYISCTINLVNSQIGNHLEYKSRSTYESNNIDWALLNVDTFLIKVEIL